MKKIFLALSFIAVLASCKKNETISKEAIEKKTISEQKEMCFVAVLNKDSTSVSLKIEANNTISGQMFWNPYEKDNAFGKLSGKKVGDTITADYDYMIEGNQQLEEKIFVLKDKKLEILSGLLEDKNGKLKMKEPKKATVSSTLSETDCNNLKFPKR